MTKLPSPTGLVAIAFGANYYHNLAGTQPTEFPHIVPSDHEEEDDDDAEEVDADDETNKVLQQGDGDVVDPDDKDLLQLEDDLQKQNLNDTVEPSSSLQQGADDDDDDEVNDKELLPVVVATPEEEEDHSKEEEDDDEEEKNNRKPSAVESSEDLDDDDDDENNSSMSTPPVPKIKGSIFPQLGPNRPPWEKEQDPIRQLACSSASTIVLTENGKLYSMGTIHGNVRISPTRTIVQLPLKCVQIAAGRHFCLARMEGGLAVCSWGAGHFGQLGHGDAAPCSDQPTVMEGLLPHHVGSPIVSIAAGYWHGMAVTEQGHVWSWGCNRNQQCGRKREREASASPSATQIPPTILVPQMVPFPRSQNELKIVKIAGGRSHSVALCDKGNVYCWGACSYGQCSGPSDISLGSLRRKSGLAPPRLVEALSKVCIVDIAAGDTHTLALTGGGRVFSWGGSSEGQLGLGHCNSMNVKPKLVSDLDFVAIEAGQERRREQEQQKREQKEQKSLKQKITERIPQVKQKITERIPQVKQKITERIPQKITDRLPTKITDRLQITKKEVQVDVVSTTTTSPDSETGDGNTAAGAAATDTTTTTGESDKGTTAVAAAAPSPKAQQHMLSHVPKIVAIHAAGNYSVGTSSSGHVYTWGCNDVGMLGLPIIRPEPARTEGQGGGNWDEEQLIPLPLVEPNEPVSRSQQIAAGTTSSSGGSSLRHFHTQSFDSSHNIALPQRVDCLGDYHVTDCAAGATFLWCLGYPRSDKSNMDVLAQSIAAGNLLPKNTGTTVTNPKPYLMTTRVGRTLLELHQARRKKALMAANKANRITTTSRKSRKSTSKAHTTTTTTTLEAPAGSTAAAATTTTITSDTATSSTTNAAEVSTSPPAISPVANLKEDDAPIIEPLGALEDDYDNSQDESASSSADYLASPVPSQKKSARRRFGPMQLMRKLSRGSTSSATGNNGASPANGSTGGGGSNRNSFRRSLSKNSSEGGNTETSTSGHERKGRKFF